MPKLTLPALALALLAPFPSAVATPPLPEPYFQDCQTETGASASVILTPSTAMHITGNPAASATRAATVDPGDELAAFTPEDVCSGTLVWEGEAAVLTVWEDDPMTEEKDGFESGDSLVLRVWDASNGLEFTSEHLSYDEVFDTSGLLEADGIYHLTSAVFTFDFGGARAVEGAASAAGLPAEFALAPNFPNPFSASTTLRYALPEAARVRLAVYDMLGRRVAVLVDEAKDAGWHQAEFRPADLASGVYVCRFEAGDFVDQQRLLLVR